MSSWVSVNGVVSPADQARISVLDHGFLYGDSVYETLRTYGGKPFLLEPHMVRLQASGLGLGLRPDFTNESVAQAIDAVLGAAQHTESMIRVLWTRGVADIGYDPDDLQHSTVVVIAKPLTDYTPETYAQGISVAVVDVRRNPITSLDPRLKTSNLLNPRLAHMQARRSGADEAVLLNHDELIAEGSRTNLFLVHDDCLCTPSVETGILNGITRRLVLQLARGLNLSPVEEALPASVLYTASEVFMTSTTMGVLAVTQLDGKPVADGKPGPVTRQLMQAYDAFVTAGQWQLNDSMAAHA